MMRWDPMKYQCYARHGKWIVSTPTNSYNRLLSFEFVSFREATLFIRAHLRMDKKGIPRG